MRVIVKVCGNRKAADLIAATEAGADLLGIIFADAWRRVPVTTARDMVSELRDKADNPPPVIGVFVDQPAEEVNRTGDVVGLDMVQLHGNEDETYWGQIERPIVVAKRLDQESSPSEAARVLSPIAEYVDSRDSLALIEPLVEGQPGGAGVSLDTELAAALARRFPFLLAGGLDPSNVARIIGAVRPWGVDVSSGVETERAKDYSKVGRFVNAAKRAAVSVVL
ncbi:MAG: phosphoribosylanthranilate isomerase [Dehalococcoidia bacterium]|jgi:phosphoribosylanthranilate isomerase|nr:phosphoribosylanthranilate isomerase [Dehalococcoidia bacterium]